MGKFKDTIICPGARIPQYLDGKAEIRAIYPLTEHEAELMGYALIGVALKLQKENILQDYLPRACILFTQDGSFSFIDDDEDDPIGYRFNLIVYCVGKWREKGYDDEVILMTLIEELVHHYWNLEDEVVTKEKVVDIMNLLFKKHYYIGDLYSIEWLNEELIRQGKQPRF